MCILYATYFFKVQFKSDNKQKTSPLASECECEIFFVPTFDFIVCTGRMLEGYICYKAPNIPISRKWNDRDGTFSAYHMLQQSQISNVLPVCRTYIPIASSQTYSATASVWREISKAPLKGVPSKIQFILLFPSSSQEFTTVDTTKFGMLRPVADFGYGIILFWLKISLVIASCNLRKGRKNYVCLYCS